MRFVNALHAWPGQTYVRRMDQNTGRTPHAEEPAEGSPAQNPEHNTAPDGQSTAGARREPDELDGNAQGAAQGGAIQGDSSHGESPRGAIQGDASPDRDAALGGDKHTEDQLTADNEVEEDALRSLDPNDAPA